MVDTSKDEMEKLQKLRTELESRLAVIENEQWTVEKNIKVLREKVINDISLIKLLIFI